MQINDRVKIETRHNQYQIFVDDVLQEFFYKDSAYFDRLSKLVSILDDLEYVNKHEYVGIKIGCLELSLSDLQKIVSFVNGELISYDDIYIGQRYEIVSDDNYFNGDIIVPVDPFIDGDECGAIVVGDNGKGSPEEYSYSIKDLESFLYKEVEDEDL